MAAFAPPSPYLSGHCGVHAFRRIAALFAVMLMGVATCVSAERAPPMPVPRPRSITQQPPTPPASTTPTPSPELKRPTNPTPAGDPITTDAIVSHDPYERLNQLPRDRQRMILQGCAAEWNRRKEAGKTGGEIWRDFLEGCIPAR